MASTSKDKEKKGEQEKVRLKTTQILVIDGEPLLADLLTQFLETRGFRAKAFSNGEKALAWYKSEKENIALVFLDDHLPQYAGQTYLNHLKEFDPEVKVALFSALPNYHEESQEDPNVIHCFEKPIEYSKIVRWVAHYLGHDPYLERTIH